MTDSLRRFVAAWSAWPLARKGMGRFPDNKRFAFSVFDDTDESTVENVGPVYRLLAELGIRTTKSVWPLAEAPEGDIGGQTLQDKAYLDFVLGLQRDGFEIGLHNVRNYDAPREMIERGLEVFCDLTGQYPRTHCNHYSNRDNVYWGSCRLSSPVIRLGYKLATRGYARKPFQGHVENSPFFWGDLCKQHVGYVRNFVFQEINLDRVNPSMPYYDPKRPYVNRWFSSCQGPTVDSFCKMICEANQDRLDAEGGVCIMYTHFGKGFCENGRLAPEFERLMRRLAGKNGWFVPVATLLDHLASLQRESVISAGERATMERRWFLEKLGEGSSRSLGRIKSMLRKGR